jgi:hypothetical protein
VVTIGPLHQGTAIGLTVLRFGRDATISVMIALV